MAVLGAGAARAGAGAVLAGATRCVVGRDIVGRAATALPTGFMPDVGTPAGSS